jgi:uncharacterized protein YjiK
MIGFIRAAAMALAPGLAVLGCNAPTPGEQQAPHAASASLFAAAPDARWRLPDRLREISGLAFTRDGRLFAHGDERAIIYQLDYNNGETLKVFAAGDPPAHGDFEDIAITDSGDFYLIASSGQLLHFREGADGAHVPFEQLDTGLGNVCEVEGLAYERAHQNLIIACKHNYAPAQRRRVIFYAWSIQQRALAARPWFDAPAAGLAAASQARAFNPSALALDPASGRMIVLAGGDNAMVELNADGSIAAGRALGSLHPQAEGAAVTPDGSLLISDEGAHGHARLARYRRAR